MRINISIDLDASEIGLANEIVATFKNITSNVIVNQRGIQSQLSQQDSTAPASNSQPRQTATADPQDSGAPLRQQPQQEQRQSGSRSNAPRQQQGGAGHSATNGGAEIDCSHDAFQPLIWQLGEVETQVQAIDDISRLLVAGGDLAVDNFNACFLEVVFQGEIKASRLSVVPFVSALADIQPERVRESVRDKITPPILKFLATKRPLDVDRYDVFPHAEAFATLVERGLLNIQGAVKTITALLGIKDKRVAAITIMGKTAELCYDQLTRDCPPPLVKSLQDALAKCTEDIFVEDLKYINEVFSMGCQTLRGVSSWRGGHNERIFALAYDPSTSRVISGSRDCKVVAWDQAGAIVGQPQTLQDCFVCALDFDVAASRLLVAGVPKKGSTIVPNVAGFFMAPEGLVPESTLYLKDTKTLSYVRVFPDAGGFAIGHATKGREHIIDFYETASSNATLSSLQTYATFRGHTDVVSALEQYPGQPDLFLSGARDGQVLLWDHRAAAGGAVGTFQSGSAMSGNMVTCVQAIGSTVLAGNKDFHINEWDLRMASSLAPAMPQRSVVIDDTVVLKIAIGSGLDKVAVSTFGGLYTADFSVDGNPALERVVTEGTALEGRDPSAHYHDIKWAADTGQLYAAGAGVCVDTYSY